MAAETIRGPVPPRKVSKKDEVINLRAIIVSYLSYWPYTIVSVILCFVLATLFLKRIKPNYQIKATVVLQGNANNKANDPKTNQDINISNTIAVNVEDEIEFLKSRTLTRLAIDSLQLSVTYTLKTVPVTDPLYDKSPIKFHSINLKEGIDNQNFEVVIEDNNTYIIKFKDKQKEFSFADTINTEIGKFKISPTAYISKYIGSTINVDVVDPNLSTTYILDALEVKQKFKLASTVELSVNDKTYQRGQDYLDVLIYFYNRAKNIEKNLNTRNTLIFIDKRLDSLRKELDEAENTYENFRSKRNITDINAQAQIYRQNQQNNANALNQVNVQLNVVGEVENYVNSSSQLSRNPSSIGIQDPGLIYLIQKYTDLQQEKARMLKTTPEKNPVFDPLNAQIEAARASIRENIRNIKASLQAQKQSLQSLDARYTAAIQSLPGEERALNALRRQQTVKENLYNFLLQKQEELSLTASTTLSSATIVDRAYSTPLKGTSRMIAYAGALMIGLILPGVFAIMLYIIRNKITSTVDIEDLGIPVIAQISRIKKKIPLVFLSAKKKNTIRIIEQFRALRNELYHLHGATGNSKGHVTLITSTISNEGKTFITTNLATALASAEKKTIVIEMDLYKPHSPEILGVYANNPGITGYLRHQAQMQDIIIPTTISPDLDVIQSGVFVDNYSELLEQPKLEALITWLKLRYDHILIKASPMHLVNDATILSALCDVTLYVVCYDYSSKAHLPFMKKIYLDKYMPKMSVILNKAEIK
ncbi:tyrosine-protein kinase [Mucilaginibacter puniceus]